jgi:hypothetical protein
MNINGLERRHNARKMKGDDFLKYVATEMENQLKEWDEEYEVMIMKLANYEFIVKNKQRYYEVTLSEDKLTILQKEDPYAIDKKLWKKLQNKGLPIIKGKGNYMDFVL